MALVLTLKVVMNRVNNTETLQTICGLQFLLQKNIIDGCMESKKFG